MKNGKGIAEETARAVEAAKGNIAPIPLSDQQKVIASMFLEKIAPIQVYMAQFQTYCGELIVKAGVSSDTHIVDTQAMVIRPRTEAEKVK